MENLQLSKEILVLRIRMRRNHIAELEVILNAFRSIEYIQLNCNKVSKSTDPDPMLIQQNIDQAISQINVNTDILSKLESELACLGEESNIY